MIDKSNLTKNSIWCSEKDLDLIKTLNYPVNIKNNFYVRKLVKDLLERLAFKSKII